MAAVVKVTRIIPAAPTKGLTLSPVVIPVSRIDYAETAEIAEYLENEYTPIRRACTKLVKVNGEYIFIDETLEQFESLVAHAGRN